MSGVEKLIYSKDFSKKYKIEIKEAKFPQNIRPHFKHDNCFIYTEEGKINELCKDCQFCGLSNFSRFCTELGMNGQMHNKDDGLEHLTYKPNIGLELRVPFTKIIQKGKRWVCHHPEAGGKKGIYILNEKIPPCDLKIPRMKDDNK